MNPLTEVVALACSELMAYAEILAEGKDALPIDTNSALGYGVHASL